MSKTTKVLASLGVVAALGVSMLPMSSYAAIKYWDGNAGTTGENNIYEADAADGEVAGEIKVKTTIDDTLSISIEGNDDNHTADTTESASHVVLLSTDPNTTLDGKIMNGGNGKGDATIIVATNNVKGYTVNLKGGDLAGATSGKSIAALSSAKAAIATATADASEWGYKVTTSIANAGNIADKATDKENPLLIQQYNGPKAAGEDIIYRGQSTNAAGDTYTLTFEVHADESQAADTYSNTVTLTASANNA